MRLLENRARATRENTARTSTAPICGGNAETGLWGLVDGRSANLHLGPTQVFFAATPAVYYARVMLGHALRTCKARDIEKARLELIRAFRATRGGRRTVRRAPEAVIE
jgi:hypothetical protein